MGRPFLSFADSLAAFRIVSYRDFYPEGRRKGLA
jgi:hypothetical protein